MTKLKPIEENGQIIGYKFTCPGCKFTHAVHVHPYKNKAGASWLFNKNLEKPTFSPSILVSVKFSDRKSLICHSFVTEGKIRFLPDCTHSLVNRIVDL